MVGRVDEHGWSLRIVLDALFRLFYVTRISMVYVRARACARVRVYVRACVCMCVRACVRGRITCVRTVDPITVTRTDVHNILYYFHSATMSRGRDVHYKLCEILHRMSAEWQHGRTCGDYFLVDHLLGTVKMTRFLVTRVVIPTTCDASVAWIIYMNACSPDAWMPLSLHRRALSAPCSSYFEMIMFTHMLDMGFKWRNLRFRWF